MAHSRGISIMVVALMAAACGDSTGPRAGGGSRQPTIVDALHGEGANPHFYWLPPMVAAPPAAELGEFLSSASPVVIIACVEAVPGATGCSPTSPGVVAQFGRETGLLVESDHFKVNLDTKAHGLTVTLDASTFTTYRISVYSDVLFGMRFLMGYADFQVAENGRAAKNLSNDEFIGLVDGRTLPIKFRIDEGAYGEYAADLESGLEAATATAGEPLCQINCSVTWIPPKETTLATLDEGGDIVTAMQFLPGDVQEGSVLLIDERETDGPDVNCAFGVDVSKRYCYRYLIFPDLPFENPVRFGICPRELLEDPAPWQILKVDYEDGQPVTTIPPPADVSDFLPCHLAISLQGTSLLQRMVRYAAAWLAAPLAARGSGSTWGATAKDLSDLFWGSSARADLVVSAMTHEPAAPTTADEVTFTATVTNSGSGYAPPSTLMFKLGGETAGTTSTLFTVPGLIPGGSHTVTRKLTPPLVAQGYLNTATADYPGNLQETDETNNTSTHPWLVTAAQPAP